MVFVRMISYVRCSWSRFRPSLPGWSSHFDRLPTRPSPGSSLQPAKENNVHVTVTSNKYGVMNRLDCEERCRVTSYHEIGFAWDVANLGEVDERRPQSIYSETHVHGHADGCAQSVLHRLVTTKKRKEFDRSISRDNRSTQTDTVKLATSARAWPTNIGERLGQIFKHSKDKSVPVYR